MPDTPCLRRGRTARRGLSLIAMLALAACAHHHTGAPSLTLPELAADCQARLSAQVWEGDCSCSALSPAAEAIVADCRQRAQALGPSDAEIPDLVYTLQTQCPGPNCACCVVVEAQSKPIPLLAP